MVGNHFYRSYNNFKKIFFVNSIFKAKVEAYRPPSARGSTPVSTTKLVSMYTKYTR